MKSSSRSLLGKWLAEAGSKDRTSLEFKEDGSLEYTIHEFDRDQKIFLTYRVEGDILITDQPEYPHEERTKFMLADNGALALVYEDQTSLYIREK